MKILIILLWLLACGFTDSQLADAIYNAEGGAKTKFPYGIKSVKCEGEQECRKICLNSIHNAKERWENAGRPEDFVVFMGRRYSPPVLNPNWVRLVKYFLNKK